MELFDTHAHLDDPQLSAQSAEVLARARAAGVRYVMAIGTTLESSRRCAEIAAADDHVRSSVGIHPNHVMEAADGDWEAIVRLAQQPQVVALGETGLDLYWKDTPLDRQQDYFDRHIRLSQQTGLPLVIHMRESGGEILAMLREASTRGPLRGVMHSFTGDEALAADCVELGLHISFAGMLTYKKSDDLRRVAATIPADRLLVETDSPYLSPHPHRGVRPNEPALVVHTAACLAEVRGASLEEIAAITTANALALFRKPPL
jgi:TatD DNase family protein